MIEDFVRQQPALQAEQSALSKIQSILQQFGKTLSDFDLPPLEEALAEEVPNVEEMRRDAQNIRPMLNPEQLNVTDSVIDAVTNNNNERANIFFIDRQNLCLQLHN